MSVQITKIHEDYWRITAGDIKLGEIIRKGSGWLGNNPPFGYVYRSLFTVAGAGDRRFGGKFETFDEAETKAQEHMKILGEMLTDKEIDNDT